MEPSSPASPVPAPRIPDSNDLAAAALARLTRPDVDPSHNEELKWARERELRQYFRRLVDPGIVRHNNEAVTKACIECLIMLCQNILDHPEEDKYRKFKPTNKKIQACIVQAKGGLEYANEVGFREHIENFQPYYYWKPTETNVDLLRVGAFVLKEHHEKIIAKEEAKKQVKVTKKEEADEIARRVKLAYDDDRSRVAVRVRMEQQQRQAAPAEPVRVRPTASRTPQADEEEDDAEEDEGLLKED